MITYQRRPVKVTAVQWRGDNPDELTRFAGPSFTVLDPGDRANCDDPDATAELFETGSWQRKLMYDGDWVISEGGLFSRVSAEEFTADYEEAE